MKKTVFIAIIILLLAACGPTDAQINEALEKTQTAQATLEITQEPMPTPEYCSENDAIVALDELFRLHDLFVDEFNKAQDDYTYEAEAVVALINIQSEIDSLNVPSCLIYDRDLFSTALQNAIDGFKKSMSGSLSGQMEYFTELKINLELFYQEHDRIEDCLPNCIAP